MNIQTKLGASAFALCTLFASSAMADAVVTNTQIDEVTKGSWMGVYGSCYNVLPQGSGRECFPEIEIGPDFVSTAPASQYDNDRCTPEFADALCISGAATDKFDVRIFSTAPPTPGDGSSLNNHAFVWGFQEAGVEAGTSQQNACQGQAGHSPDANYASTFDSDKFDFDPLSGEIKVLMGGDATFAYYFLSESTICRSQSYELFVNNVSVASGDIMDISHGKYVVFDIVDIPDNALVRLDTQDMVGDAMCAPATGEAFNSHMSGIFVDGTRACAEPPPGGDGCTPGFWKNTRKHINAWVGHAPGDPFDGVFADAFPDDSADGSMSLKQVLKQGGGGLKALGRHTVAALLNAANSDINSGMTEAEVIAAFNAAFAEGNKAAYTAQKNIFADMNEQGCPINGKTAPEPG